MQKLIWMGVLVCGSLHATTTALCRTLLLAPEKEYVLSRIEEERKVFDLEENTLVKQKREQAIALVEGAVRLSLVDFEKSGVSVFSELKRKELRYLLKNMFAVYGEAVALHRKEYKEASNIPPFNGDSIVKHWEKAAVDYLQKVFKGEVSHTKALEYSEMTRDALVGFAVVLKNSNRIYAKKAEFLLGPYMQATDYLALKGEPQDLLSLTKAYTQPLLVEGVENTNWNVLRAFYAHRKGKPHPTNRWSEDFLWLDDLRFQVKASILGIFFRHIEFKLNEKKEIVAVKISPEMRSFLLANQQVLRNLYGLIHIYHGGYGLIIKELGITASK